MRSEFTSTTERIILSVVSGLVILLTPHFSFFNASSVHAQGSPSSELGTVHQGEYHSNNWSQDKWFTTLDASIQKKYLAAYKDGHVTDADMSLASRLSLNAHKIVQYGPSSKYPDKIKTQVQNKNNWDRRADLEAGGSGTPSIWPTREEGRKAEEQLRSIGMLRDMKCPECGKEYQWILNVIDSGNKKPGQCPNCGWIPNK